MILGGEGGEYMTSLCYRSRVRSHQHFAAQGILGNSCYRWIDGTRKKCISYLILFVFIIQLFFAGFLTVHSFAGRGQLIPIF